MTRAKRLHWGDRNYEVLKKNQVPPEAANGDTLLDHTSLDVRSKSVLWTLGFTYVEDLVRVDEFMLRRARKSGPTTARRILEWRAAYDAKVPLPAKARRTIRVEIRGYNRGYLTVEEARDLVRSLVRQLRQTPNTTPETEATP